MACWGNNSEKQLVGRQLESEKVGKPTYAVRFTNSTCITLRIGPKARTLGSSILEEAAAGRNSPNRTSVSLFFSSSDYLAVRI